MKRKIAGLLALLISMTILTSCGTVNSDGNSTTANLEVQKPEKITIMTHTFSNVEDNIKNVCEAYKEMTGIELVINQVKGNAYYETVNIAIAADNQTDAVELGSVYYPAYAIYDLLWDMTDAWENSEIKSTTDSNYVDALKINGRLYGFPITKGGGTVTYIRKDLLEQLNIGIPKNYNEFYDMLLKFKDAGITPITAAGLVNSESPYDIYLREFYQDANPDVYIKDGVYVDGMSEPQMREALQRMKQAYNDGLLDNDIATNKTSDCRDKLYAGDVACFNYWAGTWAKTLNTNLKNNLGEQTEVIPMKPIEEVKYIERPPLAMAITKSCKNPEAVFKYLIEFSHDSGDGQMLFTYGAEGSQWRKDKNGNITFVVSDSDNSYFNPELSFTNFNNPVKIDDEILSSLKLFEENSKPAALPVITKESGSILPELNVIKREVIESVVTTDMSIDEGMAEYEKRASKMVERLLRELNSDNVNTSDKGEE